MLCDPALTMLFDVIFQVCNVSQYFLSFRYSYVQMMLGTAIPDHSARAFIILRNYVIIILCSAYLCSRHSSQITR